MADGLRRSTTLTPTRDALLTMKESFSFAELEPRVAGLARKLLDELPVGPGTPTPVLPIRVDRSTESILAVLACAYAEIPFVSLDARTPPLGLSRLLESLGSPDWMLDAAVDSPSESIDGMKTMRLRGDATRGEARGEPFALTTSEPPELAMVILTSGTTGVPKGVMYDWEFLEKGMHMRHSIAERDYATTRSVTFAPLPFAVGALYVLDLAVGHTVIVLDPTTSTVPELLTRLVEVQPTKLILVSQFARLLGQFPNPEKFQLPSVEAFIVGGEACRYEYVKPLARLFPQNPLVLHGLSSSESVQHVENFFRLDDAPEEGLIPVGYPNARSDVRFEPTEARAEHCELTVSGNIALGYFGDPETTSRRFFVDDDGNRRWRTGDIVSVAESGLLTHEGRIDDLVKISGYLVSTVEVERALATIPGIAAATVLVGEANGRLWLEAHAELATGSELTAAQARRHLERVLAPHMIPRSFVRHESLPVNLRGKVDREAMRSATGMPW